MSPLLILFATFFLYAVWWFVRDFFTRSTLDNVPGPKATSLLGGNAMDLFDHHNHAFMQNFVDTYGPVSKFYGFFGARWLQVYDPKALHSILVKDADLYHRGDAGNLASELTLGPGLFATIGTQHRRQRKLLNPVFSVAHMRNMTPFFHEIASKLREAIETRVASGLRELDIAEWMGRTALELIGQGGLGCSFDPLTEETSDEFTAAVKALVPAFDEIEWVRMFLPYVKYLGPAWFRRKLLDMVPLMKIQRMKNIADVMHKRSVEIYRERKAAAARGDTSMLDRVGAGKDIMSIMLKANMEALPEDKLQDEELISQMSTFILAGMDTTSNALARILHLLAVHPDVQDKLRAELVDAQEQYGDRVPYDELSALPYMDAICRETMRLYSPTTISIREAQTDAVLPLTKPMRGVDGKYMNEVAVPKGTFIVLNLQACNADKALWGDDAREWKPERWLSPFPQSLEDARIPGIYSNLMTFGAGGYSCIGFKFSQLEMKVVLSTLVRHFKFDLPEKPIIWNFGGVNYPTMGGADTTRAEMFLKIERVRE